MNTETITINPNEARPGDAYVIRFPYGAAQIDTGVVGLDEPTSLTFYGSYTISAEREIPALPTKNGAVLYPNAPDDHCVIVRDEDGRWRAVTSGSIVRNGLVRDYLRDGDYYVAFEGIE